MGSSTDSVGRSAADHTAAPSASIWLNSSCQIIELESGIFSASGIPEPVIATLAGPGSWKRHADIAVKIIRGGGKGNISNKHYLGSCRLHLALFFLVLFVGSGVDYQLLKPPKMDKIMLFKHVWVNLVKLC